MHLKKLLTCQPKKDDKSIQSWERVSLFKKQSHSGTSCSLPHYSFPISLFSTAFIVHFLSSVLFINYTLIWRSGKQHTLYHQTVHSLERYHLCIHPMHTPLPFSITSPSSIISIKSSKRLLLCTVLTVLSAYIFIYPTLSYYS